jgi:pimeloyl-ACP methyl ester carboxylesterase
MPGEVVLQSSTNVRARSVARLVFRGLQAASPRLGAWALERAFLSPERPPRLAEEERFLARGVAERVESPVGELAVWSWGEGQTVLLVHGWGSRAARYRTIGPALVAAGFRVVAFDAPGHGASSGRRSSLPETARALRFLARREWSRRGAWPRAVVAHSFGATAAILAQERGLRLGRNVLLAPAADLDGHFRRVVRALGIEDEVVRRTIARAERRLGFSWDSIRVAGMVGRLSVPALILHDPADREVSFSEAQSIGAAWAGSQLVSTPGLGHRRLMHDPDVVRRLVAFVSAG